MPEGSEQEARQYVRKLKSFYQQLTTYVVVNIVLIIINLVVDPHELWFYWVLIFWGIGIALQAINIFGPKKKFNKSWEDKKVKDYMKKNKKHND
jgi:cell division protein FtsW (lipid II flippase)